MARLTKPAEQQVVLICSQKVAARAHAVASTCSSIARMTYSRAAMLGRTVPDVSLVHGRELTSIFASVVDPRTDRSQRMLRRNKVLEASPAEQRFVAGIGSAHRAVSFSFDNSIVGYSGQPVD